MYDINFIKNTSKLREEIAQKERSDIKAEGVYSLFESKRSALPYIFNLETTNACNMRCIMCPRTSLMKRKIQVMDMDIFKNIINQIKPHGKRERDDFFKFIKEQYDISGDDKTENAFYYYISSSYVTLHGYGEPLLDPLIVERVRFCSSRNIGTYFSCVPANIKIDRIEKLMNEGLGVIKFSLDSLSDDEQKRIRGINNDFTEAYKKIKKIIEINKKNNYQTKIAIILLNLSNNKESKRQQKEFEALWNGSDVFSYVKSQDNRWLYEEDKSLRNMSHYEKYYCEFPWTSLSIMVDGSVVPCTQDYNNEIVFGNTKKDSLKKIWNNKKYDNFRRKHIYGVGHKSIKCYDRCDIKMICQKSGII